MKTLYIVRHAKSDKENAQLQDIDRPLNARGYDDAHFMASKLTAANIQPELLISSPAVRALSTALIFARKLGYDPQKILLENSLYETGTKEYIEVIRSTPDSFSSAMLFGHNSTITSLVNSLGKPFTENVPTSGITGFTFSATQWSEIIPGDGNLIFYDFPKNHPR